MLEIIKQNIKSSYPFILLIVILTTLLFCCCSPNKHLSKKGNILSKNHITINNSTISKGELNSYIQQDPNHKFLGMKMGMYIYSASRPLDDSACNFFEKYILRKVGDKPVEIDDDLTQLSCQNIKTYLKSRGCFNAEIHSELLPVKKPYAPWSYYKRRRQISYIVNIPSRAVIDTFIVKTEDTTLQSTIEGLFKQTPLKKGSWYNEDELIKIRNEVSSAMKNKGYYMFGTKYITFQVDTMQGIDKTKIIMLVSNPVWSTTDSIHNRHKPYRVSKIYIYPNYYSPTSNEYLPPIDTVLYFHKQQKGYAVTPLYFINNTTKPFIKERAIMRCILMQNNNLFSPSASENTYSALSQLRNFKYIDINYEDITKKVKDTNDLACYIRLTRNKPISLSSSFEVNYSATNSTGAMAEDKSSNFGMEANLSYKDKNLIHGAEIFTTTLKLAGEINSKIFTDASSYKGLDFFNAFEAGLDFSLELPRFLAPFSTSFYSMKFHPHTSIKTGYDIQKRSYYNRSIFTLNYGYSWNTSEKRFYSLIPVEVNYVKMDITDNDYAALIKSMDRRIQYQMSDHLVMAARLSYVYNGQNVQQRKDFNYFTLNLESAGNLLYAYSQVATLKQNSSGNATVFNIPFAQYLRVDASFIRYKYINKSTTFAYKIYAGAGYPYGNADALPYEKSFFVGGANSVRAWQLRWLGPGSSKPENDKYDRAGDITLGASLEYRFKMFGPIEGAAFTDFGNIWTFNDIDNQKGGKFSKNFYKEIACGIGFGLRADIKVLILRLDFAAKLWDPSKDLDDRFVLTDNRFKDLSLQFGIGYPF